jgi:hypothetical protein
LHFEDSEAKIAQPFKKYFPFLKKPLPGGTVRSFAMGFLFLWIFSGSASLRAESQDTPMTADELVCLQKMIFFNECSGRAERMLTWNADEDFPSFGLGHFIWYPQGKQGPYQALFPEFLSFLEAQKKEIPAWINALPVREAPWQNREEFLSNLSSERMTVLKNFLDQTQGFQTQFMIHRVKGILPRMLAAVPEEARAGIELKFKEIAGAPNGMFALIDYVNFKGEGILVTERSQGQGWGLLQVLEEMRTPPKKEDALEAFVGAAKKVLENRVKNAPREKNYSKRLSGWKTRVKNYLKIKC